MFFSSEAQWPLLPSNIVVHCRPTTFSNRAATLGQYRKKCLDASQRAQAGEGQH